MKNEIPYRDPRLLGPTVAQSIPMKTPKSPQSARLISVYSSPLPALVDTCSGVLEAVELDVDLAEAREAVVDLAADDEDEEAAGGE